MAQKLADVAQIPVAWASGLLVEEHQVTPSPAEPERAGLMQVLNAPEHAGRAQTLNTQGDCINRTENPSRDAMEQAENRKRAAVYLGAMLGADPERLLETVKPVTDPRFDSKDLAVAYVSPPIEGMRYLSSDDIERMSKLHIVLAPETQVLVDAAWERSLNEPATPNDDALASKPVVALESEHGSDVVPVETVIAAAEITKAEIGVEDDGEADAEDEDEDEDDAEDAMNMSEDEDCDEDKMSEDEIDAIERASEPSPQMTSPVAEAVLRAAMKNTQPKKSETQAAPEPVVAVVYPPAPAGATCATCQEPAAHHVGYHDYCKRCTPTSLKRKAKGTKP
jgi:hypothetical protein